MTDTTCHLSFNPPAHLAINLPIYSLIHPLSIYPSKHPLTLYTHL